MYPMLVFFKKIGCSNVLANQKAKKQAKIKFPYRIGPCSLVIATSH